MEQGYSLLEFMLAMSLSLFLSMGIINIFIYSKQIYQITQSLNAIPNKALLAFQLLSQDIRMAGFIGCVRLIDVSTLKKHLSAETSLIVWHKGFTTSK